MEQRHGVDRGVVLVRARSRLLVVGGLVLAFATGLGIGMAGLHGQTLSLLSSDRDRLSDTVDRLRAERDDAADRVGRWDEAVAALAPSSVDSTLAERSVVVVNTPGVRPETRAAFLALLGDAGATLHGEVTVTPALSDQRKADRLRELAVMLQPAGVRLPVGGEPGAVVGALLGSALLTGEDGEPVPRQDRLAVLSGLSRGGFLTVDGRPDPAALAVVLTPAHDTSAPGSWAPAVHAGLAAHLADTGGGVVLAGESGSAAVSTARTDRSRTGAFSTVEGIESAVGRVAAVLALRERGNGGSGHYGPGTDTGTVLPPAGQRPS